MERPSVFAACLWGLLSILVASCQRELSSYPSETFHHYSYVLDGSGRPRSVMYEDLHGLAVAEGDIVLGTREQMDLVRERVEEAGPGRGAIAISSPKRLWPEGVIPYAVHPELPKPERVHGAIKHFEERTSLRFVPRSKEKDYIAFEKHEELCNSSVGRRGGRQIIRLAEGCGTGSVIHEIGHAVGLWHEQSRNDRDDHILILWDNVVPEKRHNFNQQLNDGTDLGEYDFESIMHYGPYAFSANGEPTITRQDGNKDGFGKRSQLSEGDIDAIERLYAR